MQKRLKNLSLSLMTLLLVMTGFVTNISANDDEVYANDDTSVVVMVHRNNQDNTLELDFESNTAENIKINDIKFEKESIKQKDYRYSAVVGENGNHKFIVEYTREVLLENENEDAKTIERHETFEFEIKVDELKENLPIDSDGTNSIKEETNTNSNKETSDNKTETIKDITITYHEDGTRTLSAIPNREDLDLFIKDNEMVFVDNNTGTISIREKETTQSNSQTEEIKGITITTHPDGKRTLSAIPNMNDLDLFISGDEYILVDNETGIISIEVKKSIDVMSRQKRAADSVTTGNKIIPAGETITVTWRADRSFYWQLWGGISELFVNGNRAYCLEPSIFDSVATGNAASTTLDSVNGVRVHPDGRLAFTPSREQQRNVELIANYGYKYPGHQNARYEWATKKLIWIEMGWDISGGMNVDAEMAEIRTLISQHNDKPSWNRETRKVKIGETVNLSEAGLNKFKVDSYNGLEIIEDSGDTLKVRITDKTASLTLEKKGGSEQGTSYVYSDGESQKVAHLRIQDPGFSIIEFEAPLVDITIYKTDELGNPVKGMVFEYSYDADFSGQVWSKTTDENGQLVSYDWEIGKTMYYREKSAPAPIIIDTTIKSHLIKDEGNVINVVNTIAKGQIEILKVDQHAKPLAGVKFNILNASNTIVDTITTGADGKTKSKVLPLGTYKAQEVSVPNGIVLDKKLHEVKIEYANQTTPIVLVSKNITNKYQVGDISITKEEDTSDPFFTENHGKKLEGVEFGLYAKENTYQGETLVYRAGELVGKRVTNSVGQVTWHNVAIGEYEIHELKTIEGYVLSNKVYDVSVKYDGVKPTTEVTKVTQTITNAPILGSVELVKSNGTGTARLEGAEFSLYRSSDDKLLGTYTSDKDGRISVDGLRYSTNNGYYFEEDKAPYGYWINESKIYFDITEQGQTKYLIAPNALIQVHIEANKTNEDGLPLEGVGFKIRNTQNGEFVTLRYADGKEVVEETIWYTDKNGDIFTKGLLTAGEYELVEVEPLEGYQAIDPVKFTVDKDQTYIDLGELVGLSLDAGDIVNYWNRGNIEILKVDKDTKEPLAGWGFNLYDAHNVLLGYYETGEDGKVVVENLRYGLYTVEEIKVNGDYGIDPDNNKQEIFVEEHEKTYTVTFENKHADIKTSASLVERDQEEPNIVTLVDVVKYNDLWVGKEYTVKGYLNDKETGLPILIDGKMIEGFTTFTPTTKDGSVNVTFTFDASKLQTKTIVVFETLYRDNIEVVVHNDINDIDQTVDIPEIGTTLSFTDRDEKEPNIVTLTDVVKYTGLIIGKEYTVKGYLNDKETGLPILIDGKMIEGFTTFTPNSKDGSVEVHFTFDQNKLLTETIVAFEKLYDGARLVAFHTDINDIEQTIHIITYRILKKDIGTKEILKDAEFTRYDNDGNIIEVKSTDENGIVEFKLFYGEKNTAKETDAPLGYLLSDEVVEMDTTIHEDGTLFEIEYFNTPKPAIFLPPTGVDSPTLIIGLFSTLLGAAFVMIQFLKARHENMLAFNMKDPSSVLNQYKGDVEKKNAFVNGITFIKGKKKLRQEQLFQDDDTQKTPRRE